MSDRREELSAKMRLVKAALDAEPVALAVLRAADLRCMYANGQMRQLAGRDIAGELFSDAWPVSAVERMTKVLRRVAQTGEAWIERDSPWDLPPYPGGERHQKFLTYEVTRVDIGASAYLLLTVTETTDEVLTRQQRDAVASRMAEMLESVSDAIFGIDQEWRLTYANRRMAEICGASAEDLIGVQLTGALPALQGSEFEAACKRALEDRQMVRVVSDRPLFGHTFTARIYPAENGIVVYMVDTTEANRVREALEGASKRFERVLDEANDYFAIVDERLRILHANSGVIRLAGMPRDELLGRRAVEVFQSSGEGITERLVRSLKTRQPDEFLSFYRPHGRWYEFRTFPLDDDLALFGRDVTETQQQKERLARTAELNGVLNAIDADINSSLDFETIIRKALEAASIAVDSDYTALASAAIEGWVITHAYGLPDESPHLTLTDDEMSHARAAMDDNAVVVINDAENDPIFDSDLARAIGIASTVAVPLRKADEVVGALLFNRVTAGRPFSEEEITFAEKLGHSVSLALQNAALLERDRIARQRAADEIEVASLLVLAAERLGASLSVEQVTSTLQQLAARATGKSRVTIVRRSPESGENILLATSCSQNDPEHRGYLLRVIEETLKKVYETARPTVADFGEEHEHLQPPGETCDLKYGLFVPILRSSNVVGAVVVDEPRSALPFTDREMDVVAGLAAEAGTAIENALLYEEAQERARMSAALNDIDSDINASMNLAAVMPWVLEGASEQLEADGATFCLLDLEGWRVAEAWGRELAGRGDVLPADAIPHGRIALHGHTAMAINDTTSDPRASRELWLERDVASVIVIPLTRGEEQFGVMLFNRYGRPRPFSESQMDFAQKLGAHVSMAVHNTRLYEAQRHVADTLQEALLVMPENVPGLEFANVYRSATESARVGGDFFDIFPIDESHAGVVIGDISGKGLDAAVMTSLARNSIRAYSAERMAPNSTVERAGNIVLASTESWTFMSVFYGIIDLEAGVISYCNAGHPAPVIMDSESRLVALEPTGPIAGAFAGGVFGLAHARFGPGDTILLYTDGLTEARSEGSMYGEERLHELLHKSVGMSPSELVDRVVEDATRFAHSLTDDVAVLAIRVLPR